MALRKIKQNPRIKDPAIINVAVRNVESWLSYWFDRQHIPGMTVSVIDTSRTDAWANLEEYKKDKSGEYIIDADTDPGGAGEKIVFKKKGGKQLLKIATASYTRK